MDGLVRVEVRHAVHVDRDGGHVVRAELVVVVCRQLRAGLGRLGRDGVVDLPHHRLAVLAAQRAVELVAGAIVVRTRINLSAIALGNLLPRGHIRCREDGGQAGH